MAVPSLIAVILPFLTAVAGTEIVRQYALRSSMLDIPNERSSHVVPTPRGGGIAIALTVLGAMPVFWRVLPDQRWAVCGLLVSGLLVAGIGFLDDRYGLSARVRVVVHFTAASWLLFCVGGDIRMELWSINMSRISMPVFAIGLVWCTNLFNFMDGIDGFAGAQAFVASITVATIGLVHGDSLLTGVMLVAAGASAGFLFWNWPPAKIFMGDCGSGFLGFLFGAIVIIGLAKGSVTLASGMMVMPVFVIDATLTLLRRIVTGEPWYKPHRSHAYQLATQMGASHLQVTSFAVICFAMAGLLAIGINAEVTYAPVLSVVFCGLIALIWGLVTLMFAGRKRVDSSVREPHLSITTSALAALAYFRFRRWHSRIRTRRSTMPQKDLLVEATVVASDLGYTVSHDWLEGCGGGRCEVAGEKWILLDFAMSKQDRIRQILLAIHDEISDLDTISTDLRDVLKRTIPACDSVENQRKAA